MTVSAPEEAFDRLREEFYVEEESDGELTLIIEDEDEEGNPVTPLTDPVRQLVQEEYGLDGYRAHGQGISHQEDLPPELRDEDEYEEEQAMAEAEGKLADRPLHEVAQVLKVLRYIEQQETDSDHVQSAQDGQQRIVEIYGEEPPVPDTTPTPDDVEMALQVLEEEGVEYLLNRDHPNTVLGHNLETVQIYEEHGRFPYDEGW